VSLQPVPAPLLHRTTLWQWRQPAFWFFAAILLGTTIISLFMQLGFASLSPAGWGLSWLLMLVYAIPMFLLVYFLDLYEREPLSLVFGALLWGAFASTLLSIVGSVGWQDVAFGLLGENALEWGAATIAPPVEEILKGCGVLFIALIARDEIDDLLDGFVYGAIVGLGFTVVEDVLYFVGVFGGSVGGVLEGFFIRVVASGLYGHMLYSGLFGIGVAYFVTRRGQATAGKRLIVAGGLILIGILGHTLWNSPLLYFFPDALESAGDYLQLVLATTIKGAPLLVFVAVMVRLARRRERRWLHAALGGEVGGLGIHDVELATLENPKARRRSVREMHARSGRVAGDTLKRLQKAQIDLAMMRTRAEDPEHPDLVRQRAYCGSLRSWLVTYAGAAPGPTPGTPGPQNASSNT
jgi:RsiW-degrading membrane proteinase PrsW (M82 family)